MKKLSIAFTLLLVSLGGYAAEGVGSIDELISRLGAMERYDASADYVVLLPSATDEITYSVDLQSINAPTDTLSPCDYLIEWSLPVPSGKSEGFSAYSRGNHYRYRDQRLQEYHFDWDSIPFTTRDGGVQRNAQFCELLPQNIAVRLKEMTESDAYEYTFEPSAKFNGRDACRIDATESHNGFTARKLTYVFDSKTARPLRITIESNPGEITEQEVTVNFNAPKAATIQRFSEEDLIARHTEVFERFRQSNFKVENLTGTAMPSFSLPTLTGERYTHERNEPFPVPTIIALLDPKVATTGQTIADLRSALATLPYSVDVVWAFTSSNADSIEELAGDPVPGETVLMTARSLARDTGVSSFPTLIFVDRAGIIKGVQLGYNKNLPEIVMQKTALM